MKKKFLKLLKEELNKAENQKTYTNCEEDRRIGKVIAMENIIELFKNI